MQRRFLLLGLVVLAAGLVLSRLLGGPSMDPVFPMDPGAYGQGETPRGAPPASLVAPASGGNRLGEPVAAPPQFSAVESSAKGPVPDREPKAEISVSPKGRRDEPIADFNFKIVQARPFGMNRWRTVRELASAETGHDGRASLVFFGPEFEHYELRNARPLAERIYFCALLCEPGFQERFVPLYRADRQGNTGPFTAAIEARQGGTARGRLVDEHGEPVQGDVRFVRTADLESKAHPKSAGRRSSDPDGRFQLHVDATAAKDADGMLRGACMAWARSLGTGTIRDAAWPIDDLPQDLEIVVRGPGSMGGVVQDPRGTPVAGLDLILARTDVMGPRVKAHFIGTPAEPFLRSDGLFAVDVRTDAEGRFHAEGLSLAPYAIHVVEGHPHARDSSVTLTDEAVLANGAEVHLVHGASGLVVQLQAASGAPWAGGMSLVDSRVSGPTLPSVWPDKPAVLAYPAERRGGAWVCASADPGSRCSVKSLKGGAVKIDTGNARDLLVCVIGGNETDGMFDGAPVHVTAEPDRGQFEPVVFRAQLEPAPFGTLIVDARISHAEARWAVVSARPEMGEGSLESTEPDAVPHVATAGTRLLIQHGATGVVWLEADHHYASAPYRFALPPGTYTARSWVDHWRMSDFSGRASYGEQSAIVAAGETTPMDLALDGGVKIQLQVKGDGSPTDSASQWARLRIEYEDGRTIRIYRLGDSKAGMSVRYTDTWEAGHVRSTVPLPLGRGRIRGTVAGSNREIDVPVEIARNKPLALTL